VENRDAFLELENELRTIAAFSLGRRLHSSGSHSYYSIFRQQVGTDIFYRFILTESNNPDFMSRAVQFFQFLFFQNTLLVTATYNHPEATQHGWIGTFGSIDILPGGEGAKGVMITSVHIPTVDADNLYDWSRTSPRRNGQLFGGVGGRYYLMDDLRNGDRSNAIVITASSALVDPDSPLRYGLQNAFDGNSATSFVANTEDGLMEIEFTEAAASGNMTRIAIINGHTENLLLYRSYNRIKEIEILSFTWNEESRGWITENKKISLRDNYLSYQFVNVVYPARPARITVLSVFSGEVYSTTRLGGLNLYHDEIGWLFEDINEQ